MPAIGVEAFAGREQDGDKTPAQAAGMKKGDLITRAGDVIWPTHAELVEQVKAAAERKQPVVVAVSRNGQTVLLDPIEPDSESVVG